MIKTLLKNFCLITFALIAPITLPAGGIQKSINHNKFPNNTKEITLSSNTSLYSYQLGLFFSVGLLGSLSTFSTFIYDLFDLCLKLKFLRAFRLFLTSLASGVIAIAVPILIINQ